MKKTIAWAVIGIIGIVLSYTFLFSFLFSGGLEEQTAKSVDNIYSQVAMDTVQQYEITKHGGSKIDICVHAGLVAAAYLQAKDESNYLKWKETEQVDCEQAGLR